MRCFVDYLSDSPQLRVLDLGMISQGTAKCLSGLGHRVTFVDLLRRFDEARAWAASQDREIPAEYVDVIVREELDFSTNSFDAILAWDLLQHLDAASMAGTIAHLAKVIRPRGMLFCMFHGYPADEPIPVYNCSIESNDMISLREVGRRRRPQGFSPRTFERLFPQFREVHFFLKRGALFEVLVFS